MLIECKARGNRDYTEGMSTIVSTQQWKGSEYLEGIRRVFGGNIRSNTGVMKTGFN